eukprot:scaffold187090_cov37-Tisochrysis_lutea.AAC.1
MARSWRASAEYCIRAAGGGILIGQTRIVRGPSQLCERMAAWLWLTDHGMEIPPHGRSVVRWIHKDGSCKACQMGSRLKKLSSRSVRPLAATCPSISAAFSTGVLSMRQLSRMHLAARIAGGSPAAFSHKNWAAETLNNKAGGENQLAFLVGI